ncbi:MAG: hypothetical protein KKH94_04300 [Candidatus Omnitrophica bacterium]|nr:hypothetical protein [Candidatus Omnitrophota bacterium]
MIIGIDAITSENQQAVYNAVATVETSLTQLENALRGTANTTVVNDRKKKANPPTHEQSLALITPYEQNLFLSRSRQMSQVKKGSFRINDTVITVDPSKETFNDIIHKITASAEGVTANYDAMSNRFDITADKKDTIISLTKDTSNFLMEANMKPGSYRGTTDAPLYRIAGGERSRPNVYNQIESVSDSFNSMFNSAFIPDAIKNPFRNDAIIETVRENIVTSPQPERYYLNWGLDINFHPDLDETMKPIRDSFFSTLGGNSEPVVRFFTDTAKDSGLIQRAYKPINEINNYTINETV